jgi:carboxyl-terminal processing protease
MSEPPQYSWGPPPAEPARGAPAARWLAGLLLLVLVFVVGLAVGQSDALPPPTAAGPTPSPTLAGQPTDTASPSPQTATPASPAPFTDAPPVTPTPITPAPGPTPTQPADAPSDFGLFWEAYDIIRQQFVGRDQLDDTQLTYGAIDGLVESLGDTGHSVFLSPEALQRERESLSGTIVGVGALIGERNGRPVVVSVISGGPAQRAGLRSGDLFISVDGSDVESLAPEEIAPLVRGEEGTTVELVMARPSTGDVLTFNIVREPINFPAASWAMVPGTSIADLRLIQFSDGATDQLRQARDEAIAAGAQSFILDLRSNPGGFVHEAVGVASLFLADETVYIRELASGERIPVETDVGREPTSLPLVVLIDEGTASSAEIVSGAIRSAGRAELVGTTTFGTGTVLLTFELTDGSAVRIAVERWLTPDGELIFGQGISPTIDVALEPTDVPLEPSELELLSPAEVSAIDDPQLLRAIDLLSP